MSISLYTCDNCHTTFESAAEILSSCPYCYREVRPHKVGAKIMVVPCVRLATDTESEWFAAVQKQMADEEVIRIRNKTFAEKLMTLGEPKVKKERTPEDDENVDTDDDIFSDYPADSYNLSVHEHNFALMLIYYVHELHSYGFNDLQKMIMTTDIEERIELFQNVKKVFNRGINTEERGIEKPLRLTYEAWANATPALQTLYSFRQDDIFKAFLCDLPNRGNVKRIDLRQLAENPSEGFMKFLNELYNGGEW